MMARRMMRKHHVRCRAGEKVEITSKPYLSLSTKENKYDDDSRMTSWKDENGNTVVKNTYDKEGRVVEQTDAEKGTATFKYGKSSTTTTDNEGNKTVYHYDDQYRTTSIEYPDGTTC